MNIKPLAIIALIATFTSGCHMYSDSQIKPHHHAKVHKVIVQKAHTAPKPSVYHHHPGNGYTKVKKHSHPGGGKKHRHNYGKQPPKKAAPKMLLVKVIGEHGHHRHHRGHHKHH